MEGLYPRTAFLLECLVFRFGLPYISIGTFCVRLTPVNTFLLGRFAFASRLSLFLCQEKRDGLREVAFLFRRGSGSPVVRSHDFVRLSDLFSSLRD